MTQGTNMTPCSLPVIGEAESYLCFGFYWMWGQLCSRLSGFYFSSFYIKENGKKGKKIKSLHNSFTVIETNKKNQKLKQQLFLSSSRYLGNTWKTSR